MNDHATYMNRCIELARNGLGAVSPNPLVGCVIVKNDKIIGEGFHRIFGGPHAEVNAINCVQDKSDLQDATLYVNLEPCAHQGKTPPCADLIIQHKIPRIVIGAQDSYEQVAGRGIQKLRDAGCSVQTNVLQQACIDTNKRFFTFINKRRPYIILKWAQTQDGFMDKERDESSVGQNWITSPELKALSHKWRAEEDGIAVGCNTAANDNPQLNIRHWAGNNPVRIVLDLNQRLPHDLNVFNHKQKTIILISKDLPAAASTAKNTSYIQIDPAHNFADEFCQAMYMEHIQSVIIEGGRRFLETFITQNLWDEARVLTGNIQFRSGLKAPEIPGTEVSRNELAGDHIIYSVNKSPSRTE